MSITKIITAYLTAWALAIQRFMWFFNNKCSQCGGEINVYSPKEARCIDCGALN